MFEPQETTDKEWLENLVREGYAQAPDQATEEAQNPQEPERAEQDSPWPPAEPEFSGETPTESQSELETETEPKPGSEREGESETRESQEPEIGPVLLKEEELDPDEINLHKTRWIKFRVDGILYNFIATYAGLKGMSIPQAMRIILREKQRKTKIVYKGVENE